MTIKDCVLPASGGRASLNTRLLVLQPELTFQNKTRHEGKGTSVILQYCAL